MATAKPAKAAKKASGGAATATAVLDEAEAEAPASVAEQAKAPYVVSTGQRQQPKKNTTRSQRKKK